ncbi:MAG: hypothetical protein E6Q37_05700 [Crocinitomicaceae bacterium]|nr:MAG: hypothetical protein E6Q37_05700 [Crocinitomicaceae bacterium]
MDKQALHAFLVESQQVIIRDLEEKIALDSSMADIDENDTIDPEDLSHQAESATLKQLFTQKLAKAKADLANLEQVDFSAKTSALPGAVVSTEKFHFVLGYAAIPFEFENKTIVGVSVDSPIFPEIKGKQIGDVFAYSDNTYTIVEIY